MQKEILLQLKDVRVHYGGVKALDGVDIAIDEGEIVALMGPNGAGKSTILKGIFGLAPIYSGSVLWHEKMITPLSYEMARMGIVFIPQGRRVFAHLTVMENLELGGFAVGDKNELKRRIEEVVEMFPDLKAKIKTKTGTLFRRPHQNLARRRRKSQSYRLPNYGRSSLKNRLFGDLTFYIQEKFLDGFFSDYLFGVAAKNNFAFI